MTAPRAIERPTQLIDLPAGPIEYRLELHGPRTVLILHGGHMRASLPLGEDVFTEAGCTVLALSRPGYGRTPLATGATSAGTFTDAITQLCHHLGIERLAAVVGQSAGGPTAVRLAATHPDLVDRVILQSAVGFLSWPERPILRIGGPLIFSARTQKATWTAIHALVRHAPKNALRLLLRDLTIRPVDSVIETLTLEDREQLLAQFARMNSGAGFAADLRAMAHPAPYTPPITQPTLVIATPDDGAVPFTHAHSLLDAIPGARLLTSQAPSHYIWFGPDYPAIANAIIDFIEGD